jgi:vacuolar fusion protein MON1
MDSQSSMLESKDFIPDNDNHLEMHYTHSNEENEQVPLSFLASSPSEMDVEIEQVLAPDNEIENENFDKVSSLAASNELICAQVENDSQDKSIFSKPKNIFILSWAGRPIYTRFGDENQLASLMGVISALISNVEHQKNPDKIISIVSGKHKFIFSVKGPLYFVAVTRNIEENKFQILEQLEFLHMQIVSILTAGFYKVLETRPTYDLRKLIAGTENLLHSMINDFGRDPSYLLNSVHCLKISQQKRIRIGNMLKSAALSVGDSKTSPALFSIIISGKKLVTMIRPKDKALHPADLLILINFVTNVTSFKSSDSWAPLCLPKFNSKGFLYAHVSFFENDVFFIQLSLQQDAFPLLHLIKDKVYQGMYRIKK